MQYEFLFGTKTCAGQAVNGFNRFAVLIVQIGDDNFADIVFLFLAVIKGKITAGGVDNKGISLIILSQIQHNMTGLEQECADRGFLYLGKTLGSGKSVKFEVLGHSQFLLVGIAGDFKAHAAIDIAGVGGTVYTVFHTAPAIAVTEEFYALPDEVVFGAGKKPLWTESSLAIFTLASVRTPFTSTGT